MKSEEVKTKTVRNSNFELFRIICMFIIVAAHYYIYGNTVFGSEMSFNKLFMQFIIFLGKFGVNGFVLISGYFMCTQTKWKWQSVVNFLLQVTVYSFVLVLLLLVTGNAQISLNVLLTMVLPLIYGDWWFASAYFILLLISPFLASALSRIDKTEFEKLLKVLTVIWCVIPTFINNNMGSNSFLWFVYLYLVAAYIRLYPGGFFDNSKKVGKVFIITAIIVYGSIFLFDLLGTKIPIFAEKAMYFTESQSFGMALLSICMFCLFKNRKPFSSKLINTLATTTFGIYLIHDHWLMRSFIWNILFHNADYQDSAFLMIHGIVTSMIVFTACAVISYFMNMLIDKLWRGIEKYAIR